MARRNTIGSLFAAAATAACVLAGAAPAAFAQTGAKQGAKAEGTDVLIFRNGTVRTGTVLNETPTTVKFKGTVSGMEFTTEYAKADILEIKRGAAKPAAAAPAKPAPDEGVMAKEADDRPANTTGTRYCYIELNGSFGQQISQSPIRKAMKEAVKQRAEIIIVELNNHWKDRGPEEFAEDRVDAQAAFDEFHRAERILEVFATEMPDMARDANVPPPRLVFWVKKAMGGAAFLPLISNEIYFHPDGKIGGVGNLATMLKGHERVVEKQISLRLKRAIGWVNISGYPYAEELVRSMTQDWYECSLRFENGKPVLFEGKPSNPSEELLTDDAKEGNADPMEAVARNEGNDVLTLNERNAKLIGISKGTVESKSDLLSALRLDRGGIEVPGKPEKVMEDWRIGLERTSAQLRTLWREYAEIRVEGDFNARKTARGQQIQKLEAIKSLLKQWGEGIDPYLYREIGMPNDLTWYDNTIEKIKIQQRLDRR